MKTQNLFKHRFTLASLIFFSILVGFNTVGIDTEPDQPNEEDITWLVTYEGTSLPQEQGWSTVGSLAANARIVDGALRIIDESSEEMGAFRMTWTPDPTKEIVVEAKVRSESVTAPRGTNLNYPSLKGWPSGVLVSDGNYQEGLVLHTYKISNFLDRVVMMNARSELHTYRLVIRGNDMSIFVDGERKINGEGAFWKPAESTEAFIQFGSNSEVLMGESYWEYVKMGVRDVTEMPASPKLRITTSEPWDIPSLPPDNPYLRPYKYVGDNTRPFVHDMGEGMLLMRIAQGPDAFYLPTGTFITKDTGKTWQPVRNMQYKSFAPQSMIRLRNGKILAFSRWAVKYEREDGIYIGMTYRFDEETETFSMSENMIRVPEGMGWLAFSRSIYERKDGELLASVYGSAPGGRKAMLIKSVDEGLSWTYFSTLGPRAEPSVVWFSDTEMMAILRTGGWKPFEQIWSNDGGKTWSQPVTLEEGSVDADLVYMSNGVVACSYGRNGSNLMFSLDMGKTWEYHQVITDARGYNYTAIREVSPGRLLYVHDAPHLQALYVDVERLK